MLLIAPACNGPEQTKPDPDPDPDSVVDSVGDTAPELCGSGNGELDAAWVELSWDDGVPAAEISAKSWAVDGAALNDIKLNESVRFELDRPTRIHAFSIAYANVPDWPEGTEVEAGLFPDFGNNGFDFWPKDALWSGTRCIEDIEDGAWTTYVLEEPVDIDQPQLVHVVHQRQDNEDLAVWFDAGANNTECSSWTDCHSALNTPTLGTPTYWSGYSFSFQYDYLIRLYVEVLEDPPEDTVFVDSTGDLSVGSRQSWGDFDNDGWDDLSTNSRIYRNLGDGTFELAEDLSNLGISASGAVWGDYDNDGCLDLFVFSESTTSGDSLVKGDCAGGFTDMTEAAGITDVQDYNLCASEETQNHQPSAAAAWWDIDNDGDLDVYVPNFICWTDWDFYQDQILVNNGDGTFSDVSGEYGFLTYRNSGRGASPIDADQDGWVDIFINDYTLHRNLFFWNVYGEGGEDWVDEAGSETKLNGIKEVGSAYYGHSIGAAWGDLDNDGDFDLVEANLAHPRFWTFSDKTRILINAGDGTWDDLQGDWDTPFEPGAGVRYSETHSVPVLADFDQDGALDLVISATYDGRPTDFYWGKGDGGFELDVLSAGLADITGAWGVAVTDFDHDGDQDLTITSHLMENTAATGHWAQVRAIGGVDSNWGAYGATVRLTSGDQTFVRHVTGGTGQGDQDSAYLHFGLGELDQVDSVQVDFPGGGTVEYIGPWDADQRLWFFESGSTGTGWEFPAQ